MFFELLLAIRFTVFPAGIYNFCPCGGSDSWLNSMAMDAVVLEIMILVTSW
jgi:hypothetical protein